MNQTTRENYLKSLKNAKDGLSQKGGGRFIQIESGYFSLREGDEITNIGENISGVLLQAQKQMTLYPPYDPDNKQDAILNTSGAVEWDDVCENRADKNEPKQVESYARWKQLYEKGVNFKDNGNDVIQRPKTTILLKVLPTTLKDSNGNPDHEPVWIKVRGASLNPKQPSNWFDFLKSLHTQKIHPASRIINFGITSQEIDGSEDILYLFQFTVGDEIPEELLAIVSSERVATERSHAQRQFDLRERRKQQEHETPKGTFKEKENETEGDLPVLPF